MARSYKEGELQNILKDAWLNIVVNEDTLWNPLNNIPSGFKEDPHLYYTYLMMQPEYFSFACKELLNISIFPMQAVILSDMWTHKFPMLVGSRGMSKCVHADTILFTNKGMKRIGDIIPSGPEGERVYLDDLKVMSENGWQDVEYGWCNGTKETVILISSSGFELECTLNHPVRVLDPAGEIVWKEAGEVSVDDSVVILPPEEWFEGEDSFGDNYPEQLAFLFPKNKEVPSPVWGFSKGAVTKYIETVLGFYGNPTKRYIKVSSYHKKAIKQLQLLVFYTKGLHTKSYIDSDGKWYLEVYKGEQKKAEPVKHIIRSQCETFDLHLYEDHSFLSNGLVSHNSFSMAVYALLRAVLIPGRKIIIVGSVFRQSKVIFNYINNIYSNSPLLQDVLGGVKPKMYPEKCVLQVGNSIITALPVGSGDSIRGERAHDILADEFAAQSQEIFENVIAGFAAVSSDPVKNAKEQAAIRFLRNIGQATAALEKDNSVLDNQIAITGTAYYHFNHFAQYWEKWRKIIYSQGDEEKLMEVFNGNIPEGFDWEDYSIIRIPVELLPPGFMDEGQIARSRATLHKGLFDMEFGGIFSKDSAGFFKASTLEEATANEENDITLPSGRVVFDAKIKGDPDKEYVFGIDPASEVDNFSIVILEKHSDHSRIVYCWTTNAKKFKKKLQKNMIDNKDYYGYCARKIRDLMKDFNCVHIALDAQGGGKAVYEAFHDDKNLKPGEVPLWEIIEPGKPKDSDGEEGRHIIELVQFSSYDYVSTANHGLKKDFEDKTCLFPRYNPSILAVASAIPSDEKDFLDGLDDTSIYDTMEDCVIEIQELKRELAQIVVTATPSGRERWDTPEIKISGSQKGRARKDRYSALMMANATARKMVRGEYEQKSMMTNINSTSNKPVGFIGPAWATRPLSELYDSY